MPALFQDRGDAGRALAATLLTQSTITDEPVVLALPRGGVPVAFEVAARFRAPLDVCIVEQLEVPGSSGAVMGAVASERVLVLSRSVIDEFQVPEKQIVRVVKRQMLALDRRERAYRGERAPISVAGRTVILVDDGLASVAGPLTAIAAIRARSPARVVVAMPVASSHSYCTLRGLVDDLVCLEMPSPFERVQSCYGEYPEVSDLDVRRLHARAAERARHWSFPH
ncbi:MAG TPA: phosphoribosyltransferase family protein [Polyangiaceae bacterium]|nr:phosphoribosyltransferase family protein [Polyangiaceae bacterium]